MAAASPKSLPPIHIARNPCLNNTRKMWNSTAAIRTRPVTQWMSTQVNFSPSIGRNAVAISVSTQAAVTQWKARSAPAWRMTLPAAESAPGVAASVSVTRELSALWREQQTIQGVTHDQRNANRKEHPDPVPRHALQHFAAVNVAADSE